MEKTLSSKIVFECPIFKVELVEVELQNGAKEKRYYIVKNDAVFVVCFKNKKILMTKEYRSASGTNEWRVSGGGVGDQETPETAAIRETQEEVGLKPLNLKLVKTFDYPSAYIKQKIHFFTASQFKEAPLKTSEHESIKIYELSVPEVKKLLENYEVPDLIGRGLRLLVEKAEKF